MSPRPARGLGRGLDALLAPVPPRQPLAEGEADREIPESLRSRPYGTGDVFRCAIDKLRSQRGQPRKHFDTAALDELAASIATHGLIEPLVVRRVPGDDGFELIAGERRWRASQRAGLKEVLVVVRDLSSAEAFELALIENIQRADLDAIEFAEALDRLQTDSGYTQEQLAARTGKERSTIANALRLLKLPASVRSLVIAGQLSEGHARALLGAPDTKVMERLATLVVRKHLSVRQTEALVRAAKAPPPEDGAPKGKSAGTRDLELRLTRRLGTRCEVQDKNGKGELRISYGSLDELDRILEVLL